MNKKTIHIKALDTLFFRDGKPFFMGAETWADTLFPPLPSVLYGALRSTYLFQHENMTLEAMEIATKAFRITNIYLVLENENTTDEMNPDVAFPFPCDLIKFKNEDAPEYLQFVSTNTAITSASTKMLLQSPSKEKADDGNGKFVLNRTAFQSYLRNKPIASCENLSAYMISESKIGIARDKFSRTTSGEAQGNLYRVGMHRLEQWDNENQLRIAVEFENLDIDNQGFMRLGGEGKTASYYMAANYDYGKNIAENVNSDTIKVYLATPALFNYDKSLKNYIPDWIQKGSFKNRSFILQTCAIGKSINVGGFDMAANNGKGQPKIMYKAVPAGSVYYLKTNSVEMAKQLALLIQNQGSVYEQENEFGKQGFGKIYVASKQ